jgi:phosphoglycolate phosphatase-like HAD superfamily hydrolase
MMYAVGKGVEQNYLEAGKWFLAAAEALGVPIERSIVVGDSIWDLLAARRARALGVGLLSGGYGAGELQSAGAYRVYEDPADLLAHLDEVGVRAG